MTGVVERNKKIILMYREKKLESERFSVMYEHGREKMAQRDEKMTELISGLL